MYKITNNINKNNFNYIYCILFCALNILYYILSNFIVKIKEYYCKAHQSSVI